MNQRSSLQPLAESDLDMILEWRNSEQVRSFMYSSHLITCEEHRHWFQVIQDDRRRHPLIFQHDGVPMGFVNIGPVLRGGISDWGFYVAQGAPHGTGRMLGVAALAHAFDVLGLHKLSGSVLDFNSASRRFHLALGFRQEGILVDQHFDGSKYHNVIRFGLTDAEWRGKLVGEDHAAES